MFVLNKAIIFISFILILFSCSKTNRTKKKIDGTWKAVTYQRTDNLGFSSHYDATGTFELDNCENELCNYVINVNYSNTTGSGSKIESGEYFFIDDEGEYFSMYRTVNGITDTVDYGRVILVTKSDLKIEYVDLQGRHIYILEK